MSPTEQGRLAESAAAAYLETRGLTIIERNWRTRYCEIDIIARGPLGLHFVEIKYRATTAHGDGLEYITADKQRRLARAATSWCQQRHYTGAYQIDALSVTGNLTTAPTFSWIENAVGGW